MLTPRVRPPGRWSGRRVLSALLLAPALAALLAAAGCGTTSSGIKSPSNQETRTPGVAPSYSNQ